MNTITISFVRKHNGINYADAVIVAESKKLSSHNQAIQAIITAVTKWMNTTVDGKAVRDFTSSKPNIAHIAQDIQKDLTLKGLLEENDIVLKSIRVNHGNNVTDPNAVDYDLSMYDSKQSLTTCDKCKADLTERDAVTREYANKDGEESQFCEGFYKQDSNKEFHFEASNSVNLSGGRYDLLDNSDTCTHCGHQI